MNNSSSSATNTSSFVQDAEFCGECGTILPLADITAGYVQCLRCHTQWKTDEEIVDKLVWSTEIVFGAAHQTDASATTGDSDGPQVEHTCPHCRHNKATYSTRQTRSADEGQTVFYKCINCGKQDIEYS